MSIDTEIIDDAITDAVRELQRRQEKILALAFTRGYDGVDIVIEDKFAQSLDELRLGFKWEAWRGEPPARDPFGDPYRRFDFRYMNEMDQKVLSSITGATRLDPEDLPDAEGSQSLGP